MQCPATKSFIHSLTHLELQSIIQFSQINANKKRLVITLLRVGDGAQLSVHKLNLEAPAAVAIAGSNCCW